MNLLTATLWFMEFRGGSAAHVVQQEREADPIPNGCPYHHTLSRFFARRTSEDG